MSSHSTSDPVPGRLAGRTVLLTGGAGGLGRVTSRVLLRAGARLVITGRHRDRLEQVRSTLAAEGIDPARVLPVAADASRPEECVRAVNEAVAAFGPIDVLVNNAGSTGPRQRLERIPFTGADLDQLAALRRTEAPPEPGQAGEEPAAGRDATQAGTVATVAPPTPDTETMFDAAANLLGGPWNMTRAALPHLGVGASIVNVSAIVSRMPYFGRIPYVVPKAALNALSLGLARELGRSDRAIRVNTVYPGPIESERTSSVLAAVDQLKGEAPGATARGFLEAMQLHRRLGDGATAGAAHPRADDVAATVAWLASPESAAFTGHAFEVTHGMAVPDDGRADLVSWPDMRLVDLDGRVVLVVGGEDIDEALAFATAHQDRGAHVVLAFRGLEALERGRRRVVERAARPLHLLHADPLRRESVARASRFLADRYGRLDAVLVLPTGRPGAWGRSLASAADETVRRFVSEEIVAPVAIASALSGELRRVQRGLKEAPAVTFVTNRDDGAGNAFAEVTRAAVEALLRVWRHEEEHDVAAGQRRFAVAPNQVVRFGNREDDNLAFTIDWTLTLANRVRHMDAVNLWVPRRISRATGKSATPLSIERVLLGLHQGRTVVITGASAGIGAQLARFLAIAGARVLLAARDERKLEQTRDAIVKELGAVGYPEPERRVAVAPGIDVGDEAGLSDLVDRAVALFGRVDILINNAGIAGAEEMVVDMPLAAWEHTLSANLVSNYSLIRKLAPRMKAVGRGKVLNVSSYFGGEKYVAVPYPNRADYAVSKAGQRALAEILSRHLGPEIQINALAPGPVEGARLRGGEERPGLFARRGRLVLENKRLNAVHGAVLAALGEGVPLADVLALLAVNAVARLAGRANLPNAFKRTVSDLGRGNPAAASSQFLLDAAMARKLVRRLELAAILRDAALGEAFLTSFVPAPEPFFPRDEVRREEEGIRDSILAMLHLHRMPTDEDVALSTVFHLADDNVSGETFHPSGGLKFDRSVTEGEMLGRPGAEELAKLAGRRVLLIGECLQDELVALAEAFASAGVGRIFLLTREPRTAETLERRLASKVAVPVVARAGGTAFETVMDEMIQEAGGLDVVVSTPFARLPQKPLTAQAGEAWDRVLSEADFGRLCQDQLTHHFRVARKAALQPRCQIALVTPDTSRDSTREEFALALFVKTALHALTVTLGVEGERLATTPAVNQIQLTRRARGEEPRNEKELAEERGRFVDAVLRAALPAPSPAESWYLARIYRGNAMTV
jgi:malonyl-CoA reductase/3-hydroxypropionate dehydrogenase (NADP+)